MKDLQPKMMTVKEVAEVLGVSDQLIKKRIRELFPDKMEPRKTTYLNEYEVTAISVRIKENSSLLSTGYDRNQIEKTDLEKKLLIKQGYDLLMGEVSDLQLQLQVANKTIGIIQPLADIANQAIRDESEHYSITEAGKHLGIRQKEIFAILRANNLLTMENLPTQKALDQEVLQIRTNPCGDGRNRQQSIMTFKNMTNFNQRYNESKAVVIY